MMNTGKVIRGLANGDAGDNLVRCVDRLVVTLDTFPSLLRHALQPASRSTIGAFGSQTGCVKLRKSICRLMSCSSQRRMQPCVLRPPVLLELLRPWAALEPPTKQRRQC